MRGSIRRSVVVFLLIMLISLIGVAAVTGCGGEEAVVDTQPEQTAPAVQEDETTMPAGEDVDEDEKMFTLDELAEFNGKNGKPAYVAVDGVVYDVSGSSLWPEGEHTPCNLDAVAGTDLTETLKDSPANMTELIMQEPVVGQLKSE